MRWRRRSYYGRWCPTIVLTMAKLHSEYGTRERAQRLTGQTDVVGNKRRRRGLREWEPRLTLRRHEAEKPKRSPAFLQCISILHRTRHPGPRPKTSCDEYQVLQPNRAALTQQLGTNHHRVVVVAFQDSRRNPTQQPISYVDPLTQSRSSLSPR
jgi:hypothetical protein